MSVPVTVAAALAVTQWLARGMTSPLREMTAAARRMAAGDYAQRVTATSTDEVGTLGRAFNAMAADLAAADQQRRQLVATVSHELRTPLTAQRALLENLVDGVVSPDDDVAARRPRPSPNGSARWSATCSTCPGSTPARPRWPCSRCGSSDLLRAGVAEAQVGGRVGGRAHETHPADLTVTADPGRLAPAAWPTSSTTPCGTARRRVWCG